MTDTTAYVEPEADSGHCEWTCRCWPTRCGIGRASPTWANSGTTCATATAGWSLSTASSSPTDLHSIRECVQFFHSMCHSHCVYVKNPGIPGNLQLLDSQIGNLSGGEVNGAFELAIEVLDQMDDLLLLTERRYHHICWLTARQRFSIKFDGHVGDELVDAEWSVPFGASDTRYLRLQQILRLFGQNYLQASCMYSCLFYSLCIFLTSLETLSALPPDLLVGHRNRFNEQFKQIKQFYYSSADLPYFKYLVSIPTLPEVCAISRRYKCKIITINICQSQWNTAGNSQVTFSCSIHPTSWKRPTSRITSRLTLICTAMVITMVLQIRAKKSAQVCSMWTTFPWPQWGTCIATNPSHHQPSSIRLKNESVSTKTYNLTTEILYNIAWNSTDVFVHVLQILWIIWTQHTWTKAQPNFLVNHIPKPPTCWCSFFR